MKKSQLNRFWVTFLTVLTLFSADSIFSQGLLDQPDGRRPGWIMYRGKSQATHQSELNKLVEKGYRPIDFEVEGGTSRTYSVILRKHSTQFNFRSALSKTQYLSTEAEMRKQGMRPIDQETHVLNGTRFYGGVWIKNVENYEWVTLTDLTHTAYAAKFKELSGQGFQPMDIDIYEQDGTVLYAAIWVKNTEELDIRQIRNLSSHGIKIQVDKHIASGYRIADIESYMRNGSRQYAVIFVKDGRIGAGRWDMTPTQFQNFLNENTDKGYDIIDIERYETSSGLRYAGSWVEGSSRHKWEHRESVEAQIQTYFDTSTTAGMSVMIAERGQIKYRGGLGFADVENEVEAHGKTVYRIASISKAITGLLAFQLQADNILSITDSTRAHEPRLPVHQRHTIGDLLANRGRVRSYNRVGTDSLVAGTITEFPNAFEASKLFMNEPLRNPRNGYLYSTHGYTLAAAAMEKASNKTFPQILQDELSGPFGLPSLKCENLSTSVASRSKIYQVGTEGELGEVTPLSLSWKYAGGGMEASARDLAFLGIKLMDNDILTAEALTSMTTAPDAAQNYAYGWDTGIIAGENVFAKSGAQPGARSYILCIPSKKIVIVGLANTRGSGMATLVQNLARTIL